MTDITRGGLREPTRAEEIRAGGLRDEKRRRTRRHIAEVATGLFLARGFAQVTIAEVARTAEVSVNTVYTYFPSKEDLVFYPEEASAQRLVEMVRTRARGQSAAAAVLAALRAELRHDDHALTRTSGFGRFLDMARAEPTLAARLTSIERDMINALAATLTTETHATPDDPLPRLIAAQLGWVQSQLFQEITDQTRTGASPKAVARSALTLLDTVEGLLGERVLAYARR